jgi:hypothetical protein
MSKIANFISVNEMHDKFCPLTRGNCEPTCMLLVQRTREVFDGVSEGTGEFTCSLAHLPFIGGA